MSGFGTVQLSSTTLTTGQMPVPSVAVPNEAGGNLTALEGGPESTDTNGNKTAPASMYVKDGGNVAQGTTTDAAYSGSGAGTVIALLKKLVAELVAGQTTMASSLPVTIANNQTANLPIGSPAFLFKEVKNMAITAGTPVPIWTPATGKKFRLIGVNLYPTGTATSAIFLEDATGASNEFLRMPRLNSANTAPTPLNFYPNGYLSTASNNQLFLDVSVSCSVEGFVWGWDE